MKSSKLPAKRVKPIEAGPPLAEKPKTQKCIWGYHAEEKMLRHFFFDDVNFIKYNVWKIM